MHSLHSCTLSTKLHPIRGGRKKGMTYYHHQRTRHYQGCTNSSFCDTIMDVHSYAITAAHAPLYICNVGGVRPQPS